MVGIWVEGGWVNELSAVVLGVDGGLSGLANNDELINILLVGEVLVEVVLHMLNEGHVLLDEVVSSNSLELEGLVVQLVGLDSDFWVKTLGLHLGVDGHSVVVMLLVEVSGEVVQLLVESGLIDLEWLGDAWSLGSWESRLLEFDGGGGAKEGQYEGVFHSY